MRRKILTAITILAVITIGLTGIGTQSFADSETEEPDTRAWVINMNNHGNDPTTKPGYDCAHGHMSFGC